MTVNSLGRNSYNKSKLFNQAKQLSLNTNNDGPNERPQGYRPTALGTKSLKFIYLFSISNKF